VLCECGYALAPALERKQAVTARTCSICGHDLPQDQVIFVQGKLVCANCRPNSAQTIGEVVTSSDSGVIRQGKLLVKGLYDVLPDRCVKCNAPGDGKRFQKTMVWIHPWAYVGLPFGVLPFFILYFMFRKTARVDFNICKAHVQKRNKAILLTLLLLFSGVALIIFGSAVSSDLMVWVGGLGIIASIVYAVIALPLISPAKITDKHVWLRGAGKEYLHSLAEAKPR
jgi:hypothetical protein